MPTVIGTRGNTRIELDFETAQGKYFAAIHRLSRQPLPRPRAARIRTRLWTPRHGEPPPAPWRRILPTKCRWHPGGSYLAAKVRAEVVVSVCCIANPQRLIGHSPPELSDCQRRSRCQNGKLDVGAVRIGTRLAAC